MKLNSNQWNWWHVLLMQQLCVRWIPQHWMQKCPQKHQELLKLFAVLWHAPVTGAVNISTTSQLSQNRVNFTTTDIPISTSHQTVNITTSQVTKITCYIEFDILININQLLSYFCHTVSCMQVKYCMTMMHRCWWMRWEQRRMQSICYLYQRAWQFHLQLYSGIHRRWIYLHR